MMIGTALLRRRARQHSKPSMPGSMRSMSATSVRRLGEQVEALFAAGGVLYLVALALEGEAHGGPDALVVLDDQNASAHQPPAQLIQIWVGQMEPPIMP